MARLLVDENIFRQIVELLASAGHDVVWARERYRGFKDESLLAVAFSEDRIVVSEDRDFGELVFRRGLRCIGVVLIKVAEFDGSTAAKAGNIVSAFDMLGASIRGRFTVIEPGRIRQRELP